MECFKKNLSHHSIKSVTIIILLSILLVSCYDVVINISYHSMECFNVSIILYTIKATANYLS